MTSVRDPADDRVHPDLQVRELIAPFVAWMATQELAEHVRRGHREAVEAFLYWRRTDDGTSDGRRSRYEDHLALHHPELMAGSRSALECYAGYCLLRSQTLSYEDR